ncbi:MAG: hypothetical protein JW727_02300 [Candidatus Aenigmarchaeota archaeon]|nr:hypothetical protein [Candidatus Aenigmarchaeota archaeon]
MPLSSQAELTVALSEELGQVASKRFLEKIKRYSKERYTRGICNTNRLFLSLEGTEELTRFMLSLVKRISEWGKEYRIGVRDYYVPYYEISFGLEHVGKLKIPFTETVICNGKTCKVVFKDLEKDLLRSGGVQKIIDLIKDKATEKAWKVVSKKDVTTTSKQNPFEILETHNLARRGLAKGEYFYLPKGAEKITEIKHKVLNKLSESFRLEEFYPISHASFGLLENPELIELVPPESFNNTFCETEDDPKFFEAYFITGYVKSLSATQKGVVFDEIPFNLYKALEKRKVISPHYLYAEKNRKILLTFFETPAGYAPRVEQITKLLFELMDMFGLSYRVISRKVRGNAMRFDAYLPYNKGWLTVIETLYSEGLYTKAFKINGKSGQANINLENLLLAQIAQNGSFLEETEEKARKQI